MNTERARLLVVDDDAELRELAQAYLNQQGFDVETVADAVQMDAALATRAFDLIILDLIFIEGRSKETRLALLKDVNTRVAAAAGVISGDISGVSAAGITNAGPAPNAQSRNAIYSGIDGVHLQDQAITESMGPVTDFGFEHLGPSNQMITRTRRRILLAARALRDTGERPPGADDPKVYRGARSGYFSKPDDQGSWQEVYASTLAEAVHPA